MVPTRGYVRLFPSSSVDFVKVARLLNLSVIDAMTVVGYRQLILWG